MRSLNVCLLLTVLLFTPICFANSMPVVSNVTAAQRGDNSKLVDIYYDLADDDGDACTVWVFISDDDGQSWHVAAMTFIGAAGANITPGTNKHIIWDAGKDVPGKSGTAFKARVFADDGKGEQMVIVPGGFYKVDGSASNLVYVNSYMIGKYEVTNAEYCEFLNNADPTGQHYDSRMEIGRTGSSGSYSYAVGGNANYPIRYVSFDDATAYAAWKSEKTGRSYHLPDKYQWQKAAAWDPTLQKFWTYGFQNASINCSWCNCNYGSNCYGGPLAVGSFNGTGGKNDAKSYYGCYDMSGNVLEWTTESALSNPGFYVCRGGSWNVYADYCSVNFAGFYFQPSVRSDGVGFRVVLDLN